MFTIKHRLFLETAMSYHGFQPTKTRGRDGILSVCKKIRLHLNIAVHTKKVILMWKWGSTSGFSFTLFSDKPISAYMQPQSRKTERSRLRICMNLPISMFQLWNPKGACTLNVWWCNACQHVEMFPLTAAIACQQASTEARPLVETFEHWVCLKTEQPPKKNHHFPHTIAIITFSHVNSPCKIT